VPKIAVGLRYRPTCESETHSKVEGNRDGKVLSWIDDVGSIEPDNCSFGGLGGPGGGDETGCGWRSLFEVVQ